jgi:drug/metabolite transporter (DMT)-like permease
VTRNPATIPLTIVAMVAFAANSLLTRLALIGGAADALGYTGIRLASGALVLAVLLAARGKGPEGRGTIPGNWASAAALAIYALGFSLAYVRLGVALGALVLFMSVQITMILWGVLRGARPSAAEWAGIAMAIGGLVYLLSPGLFSRNAIAPDPLGVAMMVAAGLAWGVYSLRGRSAGDPIAATAGNFIRTLPLAIPLLVASFWHGGMSGGGVALALASGVLASGLGYAIWYRALPGLAVTQAAIVQLTVPVIAAVGAVVFVGEPMTPRLAVAGAVMLGGVALAVLTRTRRAG